MAALLRMRRSLTAVFLLVAAIGVVPGGPAIAREAGTEPPPNPYIGPAGTATMHGDSESSDTTPHAGPGSGPVDARYIPLAAACPTVLIGQDGYPMLLCTSIADRSPTVYLLDPDSGLPLATMRLTAGELLGGVYAYLDHDGQLVTADGSGDLLRIGHHRTDSGSWELFIAQRTPIGVAGVVSIMPDWAGRVWFATADAVVGFVDTDGSTASIRLPEGEGVGKGISSAPEGVSVATTHALYLLSADRLGEPEVLWRREYDRGSARKPGQLSWGTGASPTFFGPRTGSEYLTITDNADGRPNLLVLDARTGKQRCKVPVLPGNEDGIDGTENSPVAYGRSIYVASTYGYPYPAYPDDAGPSDPETAPFVGGMTRVDVRPGGAGCEVKWHNAVRSAAVPRMSLGDGLLYTITRQTPHGDDGTTPLDTFEATVVDPETGATLGSHPMAATSAFDTLEMVGTIDAGGVQYQGTLTGVVRITAR